MVAPTDTARCARHGRVILAAGLIAVCLLAVGCGSSTPSHRATSNTVTAQLAFSTCIRAHGVPDFPDPGANISGPYITMAGIQVPTTIDHQSPAFEAARRDCQAQLSAIFPGGPPPITESRREALIRHAQCMRTHGGPTQTQSSAAKSRCSNVS
jgi:hypothetical protein